MWDYNRPETPELGCGTTACVFGVGQRPGDRARRRGRVNMWDYILPLPLTPDGVVRFSCTPRWGRYEVWCQGQSTWHRWCSEDWEEGGF